MNIIGMFILGIFLHIVDDYYLQGWLSLAKQREYWEKNAPEDLYKYDYIWALLMHSFSWSFMIMLPIFIKVKFILPFMLVFLFVWNVVIHAITDNKKANKKQFNLWQDQIIHVIQIIFTYWYFYLYIY